MSATTAKSLAINAPGRKLLCPRISEESVERSIVTSGRRQNGGSAGVLFHGSALREVQRGSEIANLHMTDSIGHAAEVEKAAIPETSTLSDAQLRLEEEPMIGSSSTILGFGPESAKALRDDAEPEVGIAESKSPDQQHDKLLGVSGVVRRSSTSGVGKRKRGGDKTASRSVDEEYVICTKTNRIPMFYFQRKAQERQETGEDSDSDFEIGQRESLPASSAVVHSGGKQSGREIDEDRPRLMDMKPMSLPDELVEKILAMLPFPKILKTCVLNKSWNTNLSAIPDALVFQDEVRAVSGKWKHYCPIILNIEKEWLVVYDREYNRWQNIPLKFEREILTNWFSTQKLRGAGSLLCGVFNRSSVFVTNIVTKTWKWLPSRPNMEYPKEIHLLPVGSKAYQVLVITKDRRATQVCCQLYDSRTESWTVRRSTVRATLSNSSSVYLNGVLYFIEYDPDDIYDVMKVLSYNVRDGTWTNIPHPFRSMLHEIETYELLVCQNHVMVILHLHSTSHTTTVSHNTFRNTLLVYKMDPVSLDIKEVARGPPEPMSATCSLFASDFDCIYFGDPQVASSSVVQLKVENREWSCLPAPTCADGSFKNKWATFSFQPGMNPFVPV